MTIPVIPHTHGSRTISPTDISQFIRLEQCERYLRLRLHERSAGGSFMTSYGVAPQSIPPLLTGSGAAFEQQIEADLTLAGTTINHAESPKASGGHDSASVMAQVHGLAPGSTLFLLQPRLQVPLGAWLLRGDIDILRLERDAAGTLHLMIADMKSSTAVKVEHRLQVAFYAAMLAALCAQAGVAHQPIQLAILYRGPADVGGLSRDDLTRMTQERAQASTYFHTGQGYLEIVANATPYHQAVADLVTNPDSIAARVADSDFADLPYHLGYKCDGCLYNELCMKWSAEHDDMSLLPHLTEHEKRALRREQVTTISQVAHLKELSAAPSNTLAPTPETRDLVRRLSATWPIGPRLDEIIHRARSYRKWKGDPIEARTFIPSKGYGSLPFCGSEHNPNLVRIYIDAQHDYLQDRIYMLGALVVGCEHGVEHPNRRRSVISITDGPPDSDQKEEQLFLDWVRQTMAAVGAVAAPDTAGKANAPIHVIFFNSFEQRLLLDGLARHFTSIVGATPLYDFMTQLAAFDSPIATFLDREMRDLKNYPMVCQSLQAVAAFLKFNWNEGLAYREIFRARMFDFWGKLAPDEQPEHGVSAWYTNRSRFNSQIPLEYAYGAWNALQPPAATGGDDFAAYRAVDVALLTGFHARRLDALEWITHDFKGNKQTEKTPFSLPDLATFDDKAHSLADALHEFVTIERHVELQAWKTARLVAPEQRVLAGDTLIVRYDAADQDPETIEGLLENERRRLLEEHYRAEYRLAKPNARAVYLSNEQKAAIKRSQAGMVVRLRLTLDGIECGPDEVLGLTTIREGDRLIMANRTTVDSRLPIEQQTPFTPTAKQLLYGMRVDVQRIVHHDPENRAPTPYIEATLTDPFGGGASGFVFRTGATPLVDGERYTLDSDPNNWYGAWCAKVTQGLRDGQPNAFYTRLGQAAEAPIPWDLAAIAGQRRFAAGLRELYARGALHSFELDKFDYIADHGSTPILLVQGPPGTGKSYTTAFALFARVQGALSAKQPFRILVGCKTHAATDVLLKNIAEVQDLLRALSTTHPAIFTNYFEPALLNIPLYRFRPRELVHAQVIDLVDDRERPAGTPTALDQITAQRWCVVAATPGGVYKLMPDKGLFGTEIFDCLVLDEASQMNLPEAMMAALGLKPDGRLIVVGDHRQMPPIIKHDWSTEPRRTFQEYRSYESLFMALLAFNPPIIRFAESFRLHSAMAEFLRREIYAQDGIAYHSNKHMLLPGQVIDDAYVASVLAPEHTMIVILHDEAGSQLSNAFEQALLLPLLASLTDPAGHNLDPRDGVGIVVPHRAQRAALQTALPALTERDPATGAVLLSAVDTVERFQGNERTVMLISATESDREYLRVAGKFLLDPRRLNVALSRAKQKLILVASRSIFTLFSADDETFANAQLWKNMLTETCTTLAWQGTHDGIRVEVWGNGRADLPGGSHDD